MQEECKTCICSNCINNNCPYYCTTERKNKETKCILKISFGTCGGYIMPKPANPMDIYSKFLL